ncbi:MAG: NYN domain-containing protein [Balneolaceae bacterium]|nr:MAG: NYN domain-containing protein [Balneolaceae bacterium]
MRCIVYVDGFNLYYGLFSYNPYAPKWVKDEVSGNRKFRWLDLYSLFADVLPKTNRIATVKYFTAYVNGERDPLKPIRQQAYINGLLSYRKEVRITLGQFKSNIVDMPLARPIGRKKYAQVIKTEEKGSDVNLAVHMVNDGWKDEYDMAVLCSNDTDLIEAVKIVRHDTGKLVCWVTPNTVFPSKEIKPHVNFHRKIMNKHLKRNQLPEVIPGTNITKPANWN